MRKRIIRVVVLVMMLWILQHVSVKSQGPLPQVVGIDLVGYTGWVQVVSIGLTPDNKKWAVERNGNDALGADKAGHLKVSSWFTPLPYRGNTVIIGHSWHLDEYQYTPFSNLASMPMGNIIKVFTSDGGVFEYQVTNRFEVGRRDNWVIMQKENRLTLLTSTADADSILVVFAYP